MSDKERPEDKEFEILKLSVEKDELSEMLSSLKLSHEEMTAVIAKKDEENRRLEKELNMRYREAKNMEATIRMLNERLEREAKEFYEKEAKMLESMAPSESSDMTVDQKPAEKETETPSGSA